MADASHELKTPLAVIDANIEAELVDKKRPSKWLKNIQNETQRMNTLITSLLSLVQISATSTERLTTFNVSESTQKILESMKALAKSKSLNFSSTLEPNVTVSTDQTKLTQIITILIDNAIKYTDSKGTIDILVRAQKGTAHLVVTNTHPAIPEDKLNKLFDRFYQADKSHKSNGHGLGLAIAKSAAQSIGADLSVTQKNDTVIFTVSLPQVQTK